MKKFFIRKPSTRDALLIEQNDLLRKLLAEQTAIREQMSQQQQQIIVQAPAQQLSESSSDNDFSFDMPEDEVVFVPTHKMEQASADLKTVDKREADFDQKEVEKLRRAKERK